MSACRTARTEQSTQTRMQYAKTYRADHVDAYCCNGMPRYLKCKPSSVERLFNLVVIMI